MASSLDDNVLPYSPPKKVNHLSLRSCQLLSFTQQTSKQKKSKASQETSQGYPVDSEATPVVPASTVGSKESPAAASPPAASAEKPDETEAAAETHIEFDPEQFQQLFANFLQSKSRMNSCSTKHLSVRVI
jgi:hypothetical protein